MRRSQFAQAMVIAAIIEVVGTALTLIGNFVTDSAPQAWQALVVPGVAMLVVSVKAGVGAVLKSTAPATPSAPAAPGGYTGYGGGVYGPRPGGPPPTPPPGGPPPAPPPAAPQPSERRPSRPPQVSIAAALLTLLVVCGGGGAAIVYGVGYGYGWVTGNENGSEWLTRQAVGTSGSLRLTVNGYLVTPHFTRVDVTVENFGGQFVNLPLQENCFLTGAGDETLQADPFRSDWPQTVAAQSRQRGTIVFGGRLREGAATLTFAVIFGPGGQGSIAVRGIQIREPVDGSALPAPGAATMPSRAVMVA